MTAPPVTWGEALGVRINKAGGMPGIANRLRDVWGATAESRSTLDKLRGFSSIQELDDEEKWRAYQVLIVIGLDPADWGVERESLAVPPGMVDYFHKALTGAPTEPNATDIAPIQAKRRKNPRRDAPKVKDTPSYRADYVTMGKCASGVSPHDLTVDALAESSAA